MREKLETLAAQFPGRCRFDEPMSRHTTMRVGGPADLFVEPQSRRELERVVGCCVRDQVPWLVIGGGSNLIVRDGGIRGVVVRLGARFARLRFSGETLRAQAGARLKTMATHAARRGLAGLEFGVGIPGTLGGSMVMNAGAYGGCLGDVVTRVWALDPEGEMHELDRAAIDFAYRRTALQGSGRIVVEAEMALRPDDPDAILARMREHLGRRQAEQPVQMPNSGSIFKRPLGDYAGRLIDQAGLKGFRIGGAMISDKHANFIVNVGGATARDVIQLIEHAADEVAKRFGIRLEREVVIVGEDAPPSPLITDH